MQKAIARTAARHGVQLDTSRQPPIDPRQARRAQVMQKAIARTAARHGVQLDTSRQPPIDPRQARRQWVAEQRVNRQTKRFSFSGETTTTQPETKAREETRDTKPRGRELKPSDDGFIHVQSDDDSSMFQPGARTTQPGGQSLTTGDIRQLLQEQTNSIISQLTQIIKDSAGCGP
jgi:putative ubiquitin-RnfH superfamily antitoxin RatB of RatAB toxin-antitoxin module